MAALNCNCIAWMRDTRFGVQRTAQKSNEPIKVMIIEWENANEWTSTYWCFGSFCSGNLFKVRIQMRVDMRAIQSPTATWTINFHKRKKISFIKFCADNKHSVNEFNAGNVLSVLHCLQFIFHPLNLLFPFHQIFACTLQLKCEQHKCSFGRTLNCTCVDMKLIILSDFKIKT